jgi:predicted nucleotide-binding protein (sugar kinase/HSP70/actin superfamily)
MSAPKDQPTFDRFITSVKQFDISGKTLLLPDMAPFAARLLAASFRAIGVPAVVMETYKGLSLGKEFTSGKECFPCQVTLGDILYHLDKEKRRLGSAFSPDNYVYFLPEADGPCRFGMYNKMQRLILDRFDAFKEVPIVYISTRNAYATETIMPPERSPIFRRLSFVVMIIADVLDRIVWRVRPYEMRPGMTDEFMQEAIVTLSSEIESVGADLNFTRLYRLLEEITKTARSFIDPSQPRRPRIGMIGEIYLRHHPDSNQDLIRLLEQFGGEVVDASCGEWINFVAYERARKLRRQWITEWREGNFGILRQIARKLMAHEIEKLYQRWRQGQVYRTAWQHLDIQPDHSIGAVERRLDRKRLFSFDIGTEAALSIGGALEYAAHGFDGIVNVFPFTCMPSTICSAILKPLLHQMKIPYIDTAYDGSAQPNREAALHTFMYQAKQHLEASRAHKKSRTRIK